MNSFYSFYRWVGWPILTVAFRVLRPFVKKVSDGISARTPKAGRPAWLSNPPRHGAVWIHCASGEFEYAKPVIRLLKASRPSTPILVTYFSTSYVKAIENFSGVDIVCPLPWDTPSDLQDFLNYQKPSMLLIARTDVWPEMARQAHVFGIPSLLFSATLTSKSGRARGLGRWMSRATFSQLTSVFAVSDEDTEEFRRLGLETTEIVEAGDTRYDQVLERLAHPKEIRAQLFDHTGDDQMLPIVVCGSTWPEDESVIFKVAEEMKDRARFVIVPHEPTPDHLSNLEKQAAESKLTSLRYTTASTWTTNVLLVDQVGILAELYLKGDFAFVGGSFRKNIHSVMEPLAAGCLTFVGPFHSNNREALALKHVKVGEGLTAVQPIRSSEDFEEKLKQAMTASRPALKTKVKMEIEARTGASLKVIDWITSRLPAE